MTEREKPGPRLNRREKRLHDMMILNGAREIALRVQLLNECKDCTAPIAKLRMRAVLNAAESMVEVATSGLPDLAISYLRRERELEKSRKLAEASRSMARKR